MVNHRTFVTENADQTAQIGRRIGSHLNNRRLFLLHGDLGSGKTTFAQGFAMGLGISQRILSPTFIIMRTYPIPRTPRRLHHIDLYRVPDSASQESLRLVSLLDDPDAILLVEWAEYWKMPDPVEKTECYFRVNSDGFHTVEVNDFAEN
jgi:tRNA threonylcarbamoyladenosine biosynthesis protein TsaE